MEKFVIEGGVPLSGTIVPAGNKNGALPILAACLLTEDEVILRNVPNISDVVTMTLLLESLGARVQWRGPGEVSITHRRGRVPRGRPVNWPSGSGPRSCSPGRCWRALGGRRCLRPAAT